MKEPIPTAIKFKCQNCGGAIISEIADPFVQCGHCDMACNVPQAFTEGIIIDDFQIIERIGSGGMGSVYKALQLSLDRIVALKILHGHHSDDQQLVEQLIYEARSVACLNHPNIIQAFKIGQDCGIVFFAMEYVEGKDLKELLEEIGPFDEISLRAVGANIITALNYAWNKSQLIHRDIKPENIMLSNRGDIKLMDLGLSRKNGDIDEDEDQISGTLQYISPEQVTGKDIDYRSDQYSLGATLYHLATGKYLFEAPNAAEMLEMQVNTQAPLLSENAQVSNELSSIINKMLSKFKEERYENMDALINDFSTFDTSSKRKLVVSRSRRPVFENKREKAKEEKVYLKVVAGLAAFLLIGLFTAIFISKSSGLTKAEKKQENKKQISQIDHHKIKLENQTAGKAKSVISGFQRSYSQPDSNYIYKIIKPTSSRDNKNFYKTNPIHSTGSSKIVVGITAESVKKNFRRGTMQGKRISKVTFNGTELKQAVQNSSIAQSVPVICGIYYLDKPSGEGVINVHFDGMVNDVGISVVLLKNTADGVSLTARNKGANVGINSAEGVSLIFCATANRGHDILTPPNGFKRIFDRVQAKNEPEYSGAFALGQSNEKQPLIARFSGGHEKEASIVAAVFQVAKKVN